MRQILLLSFFVPFLSLFSQAVIIDEIVAVVGNQVVFSSDIKMELTQMKAQGMQVNNDDECKLLESLLMQKLLMHQAILDSVEVSESMVEQQLDSRLKYFISMIGSKEKLEEYFAKTMTEIREDLRPQVREQLVVQKMQGEIAGNISTTPSEIRQFYKSLPSDSIPYVKSMVEIRQIVLYPSNNEEAIFIVKENLLDLRKRINDGEKFSTLARLYSEDPMSARVGGEIGFFGKGELDPEYAKAAFSLKEGQISKIVESQFGFHIIQLIERKEDRVNTRHILIKPKASQNIISVAQIRLDSIRKAILIDSITFERAAQRFTEDKGGRSNGGMVMNAENNSTKFAMDQLTSGDFYVVKDLQPGEISEPYLTTDENQKQVVKIIQLKSRTLPHKANMEEDYELIESMASNKKRETVLVDWISEKMKTTYVQIDKKYSDCKFDIGNWLKDEK